MTGIRVLVVEDEEAIREMLFLILDQAGFSVETAVHVQEASLLMNERLPQLILLDWMLPGMSGIEWARRIRRDSAYADIPIILLTAKGEEEDKVRGLEGGVDDYVVKPFSPRELIARIKAVLRRASKCDEQGRVVLGQITLHMQEHRISIQEYTLALSPTEYRLLEFFITHPDRVYSRSQLLDQVWGRNSLIEERTVDVHIRRVRKILSEYQCEEMIQTVRGFGYRFSEHT